MAVFKFKMQNILNVKEKLENQRKVDFAIANRVYLEEIEKLEILNKRKDSYEEELKNGIKEKIKIRNVIQLNNAIENMKQLIVEQKEAINKAEKKLEKERERFNEAIKERKTYEKLKEKAFEEFLDEIKAEEDKVNDELVSYRYGKSSE